MLPLMMPSKNNTGLKGLLPPNQDSPFTIRRCFEASLPLSQGDCRIRNLNARSIVGLGCICMVLSAWRAYTHIALDLGRARDHPSGAMPNTRVEGPTEMACNICQDFVLGRRAGSDRRPLSAPAAWAKVKPANSESVQRTTNTSLPRKWRAWLTSCAATASLSL
jgi:hypothetical protein